MVNINDFIDEKGELKGNYKTINIIIKILIPILTLFCFFIEYYVLAWFLLIVFLSDIYSYFRPRKKSKLQEDIDKLKEKVKKV